MGFRAAALDIKRKSNLRYYKRQKAQRYATKQLEEIPKKCGKLCKTVLKGGKIIVMDNGKYFTFTKGCMPGNEGHYTSNKENVPDNVKFNSKAKFEMKFLVLVVISSDEISDAVTKNFWACHQR